MALYHYRCPSCHLAFRKILEPVEAKQPHTCTTCGAALVRTPRPPTNQVKEVLDNGWMTRRVERLADAERLVHERAAQDPLKDK